MLQKAKDAYNNYVNYDAVTGAVRAIVPATVAWLAARGIGHGEWWIDVLVTVVVTAGAVLWSIFNNRTGKVVGGSPPPSA